MKPSHCIFSILVTPPLQWQRCMQVYVPDNTSPKPEITTCSLFVKKKTYFIKSKLFFVTCVLHTAEVLLQPKHILLIV